VSTLAKEDAMPRKVRTHEGEYLFTMGRARGESNKKCGGGPPTQIVAALIVQVIGKKQ
jgi:hypothetical protein